MNRGVHVAALFVAGRLVAWPGVGGATPPECEALPPPPACAPTFLERGVRARNAGRLDEAVEAFRLAAVADPVSVPARLELAVTESWRGRLDAADSLYRLTLELDPANRSARLGLARVAAWRGDWRSAEERYRELLNEPEVRVGALTGLAVVREARLDFAAARRLVAAALVLAPEDREALALRARLAAAGRVRLRLGTTHGTGGGPHTTVTATVAVRVNPDLDLQAAYVRDASEGDAATLPGTGAPTRWQSAARLSAAVRMSDRVRAGLTVQRASTSPGAAHFLAAEAAVRATPRLTLSGGVRPAHLADRGIHTLAWLGASTHLSPRQELGLQAFRAAGAWGPGTTALVATWGRRGVGPLDVRTAATRGWTSGSVFTSLRLDAEVALGPGGLALGAARFDGGYRRSSVTASVWWRW